MKQPSSDNAYFVVSHELIVLLQWLIEHEQESLKKIIARALPHGLEAALQATQSSQHQPLNQDELQQNVVDFFSLLETAKVIKNDAPAPMAWVFIRDKLDVFIKISACFFHFSQTKVSAASLIESVVKFRVGF